MLFLVTRRCAEQVIAFPVTWCSLAHFGQQTQRLAIFDSENPGTFWDRSSTVRISTSKVRQLAVGLIALQGESIVLASFACTAATARSVATAPQGSASGAAVVDLDQ